MASERATELVAGWPEDAPSAPEFSVLGHTSGSFRRPGSARHRRVTLPHVAVGGRQLEVSRWLGSGSAGYVFAFAGKGAAECEAVAVKTVRLDDEDQDYAGYELYREMAGKECARLFVPTRMVVHGEYACFGMPCADGTLMAAVENGQADAAQATAVVARALQQLHRDGFSYCDLKPNNVLVLRRGEALHIAFCDLGSLARAGEAGSATYPPPDSPTGLNVPATEASAAWGLGAFLLTLLRGHDAPLKYDRDGGDFTEQQAEAWRRSAVEALRRGALNVGAATPAGRAIALAATHPKTLGPLRALLEEASFAAAS